ncbi:hypothetical protein JNJ66_04950 [Candidatus Saccharibacteria bacterium]|nr:hypothetical protein [Candidatus Saccharibacteria bacterium]
MGTQQWDPAAHEHQYGYAGGRPAAYDTGAPPMQVPFTQAPPPAPAKPHQPVRQTLWELWDILVWLWIGTPMHLQSQPKHTLETLIPAVLRPGGIVHLQETPHTSEQFARKAFATLIGPDGRPANDPATECMTATASLLAYQQAYRKLVWAAYKYQLVANSGGIWNFVRRQYRGPAYELRLAAARRRQRQCVYDTAIAVTSLPHI